MKISVHLVWAIMSPRAKALCLLVLLVAYVGTYLVHSRMAYAEADRYGFAGFYYHFPDRENIRVWRIRNYGCVMVYSPLNWVDQQLGTGRSPAREPHWGLSR